MGGELTGDEKAATDEMDANAKTAAAIAALSGVLGFAEGACFFGGVAVGLYGFRAYTIYSAHARGRSR